MFVSVCRIVVKLKLIWQPYGRLIHSKASVTLFFLWSSSFTSFPREFIIFPYIFLIGLTPIIHEISLFLCPIYSNWMLSTRLFVCENCAGCHTCHPLVCADGWVLAGLSCERHVLQWQEVDVACVNQFVIWAPYLLSAQVHELHLRPKSRPPKTVPPKFFPIEKKHHTTIRWYCNFEGAFWSIPNHYFGHRLS